MKLSEQWLRQWVSPKLTTAELAECLTMAGLEVDSIEPVAARIDRVLVGKVLSVEAHPNADRLHICSVDIGRARPLTIVCGASNVRTGLKVVTALVGAELPGGLKIKSTEIRGQKSSGMLCSATELGLEEESAGLLELDSGTKVGQDIVKVLHLDDHSIDIDLTPNRSDCLSVAGIAREVSALTGVKLRQPVIKAIPARNKRTFPVQVQTKKDCPHYVGRVIEGINANAESPLWLKEHLRRSGLRCIHPVVDITNYVMLELGQPMHAFDLGKLDGAIVVRKTRQKETLTLLDGSEIKLEEGSLLIADKSKPLALAGIMGGLDSGVSSATTDLFLESAFFQPAAIIGRARSLGLHTDSSHRFERGVDPALQRKAVERATGLLLDIVGGVPGPVIEKLAKEHLPKRKPVQLRHARVERVLGIKLASSKVQTIIGRLGMKVSKRQGGWRVQPPSFRFDIEREVDLIEEIARLNGYRNLPSRPPAAGLSAHPIPETVIEVSHMRATLVNRDFQEIVSYSFVDPELQKLIYPEAGVMRLANPIASDMSEMRAGLWPGLLQALIRNRNRQQARVRLFELGKRFNRVGKEIQEANMIGGVIMGLAEPEQWALPAREADFYDLKGDVEALTRLTGNSSGFRFEAAEHPSLHSGQSARICRDNEKVGWIGALHPDLQAKLGLEKPIWVFEVDISALKAAKIPKFHQISRYPTIRRDIAVVVAEDITSQKVLDCVTNEVGELLANLELFDEYRGEGIDSGRKSLALGLTLQDSSRTLNDEAVDALMKRVVGVLSSELSAQLRH
ncbi:MAG: phenylalanine--tRNA ligase subunit beta [Acidiferrobacterales bacterium]